MPASKPWRKSRAGHRYRLILTAVFVPTYSFRNHGAALPAVRRDYSIFGAHFGFNALTLSPALSALLLPAHARKPGGCSADSSTGSSRLWPRTHGYVGMCGALIRKATISMVFSRSGGCRVGWFGKKAAFGFRPEEDQGTYFVGVQLPFAASTDAPTQSAGRSRKSWERRQAIKHYTTVVGYSPSERRAQYLQRLFWVTLKEWSERAKPEERFDANQGPSGERTVAPAHSGRFPISPPPFRRWHGRWFYLHLQDRSGRDLQFLSDQLEQVPRSRGAKRPELAGLSTTFCRSSPGFRQCGSRIRPSSRAWTFGEVYRTLQTFMGGLVH